MLIVTGDFVASRLKGSSFAEILRESFLIGGWVAMWRTAAVLKTWLAEPTTCNTEVVFPTACGARLSPDSVKDLVDKHVALACQTCPSLRTKRVTPHVLRHTMAMQLLQAGVDRAIIALWLGHESVETTQIYLDANLTLKEEILARTISPEGKLVRFKPDDELMTFLNHL
jgi:integrase